MEHALGMNQKDNHTDELMDGIVMLLDPDMILLRPLTHDFTHQNVLWAEDAQPATTVVRHGYPMAQQDGYLGIEWMQLNASYISNKPEGSYREAEKNSGPRIWNSGPPYLATVSDMYKIAFLWSEYTPRILDVFPELFAEMYGFIVATVQLELPMTLIRSIVVSGPSETHDDREGWPYVDALPDEQVCDPISLQQQQKQQRQQLQSNKDNLPFILHYCQKYAIGKVRCTWFLSLCSLQTSSVFYRSPYIHSWLNLSTALSVACPIYYSGILASTKSSRTLWTATRLCSSGLPITLSDNSTTALNRLPKTQSSGLLIRRSESQSTVSRPSERHS